MEKNTLQVVGFFDDNNYFNQEALLLNGKVIHRVCDLSESPEDATIGRDLTSSEEVLSIIAKVINLKGEVEFLPSIEAKTRDEFEELTYN